MDMSRRGFIGGSAALVGAAAVAGQAAAVAGRPSYRAADYAALRKQLRAFHPDECHDRCKDPAYAVAEKAIHADLDAYAAAHPGYDALDMRRACYLSMRKHFVPFLFTESPFYFEAGINGGWIMGKAPARGVNRLCGKFYKEQALVPDEEFRILRARNREALALCCGPFSDDMHHVPPLRTILAKGFGGVRAEVVAALEKCPKNDPHGRKQLETALVGLDTIHEIQLKFAAKAEELLAEGGRAGARPSRKWLERIAECAKRCPWEPPKTFFEGLNTIWFVREILSYVDGLCIFSLGRPDAMLYDFYKADLAAGRLTVEEARDLVARWLIHSDAHMDTMRKIDSYSDQEAEMPMSLGGCDKDGKPVWNELTEMFLDAHLGCDCVFPKLHCRVGSG